MASIPTRTKAECYAVAEKDPQGRYPWVDPRDAVPVQTVLVETADTMGHVQSLRLKDGRWWIPDYSLFVNYIPARWRYTY